MVVNDFAAIIKNRPALLDLRSPGEFSSGTIPDAVNMPLLNDEERHQVGLTYREKGRDEALDLGHRLVTGDKKQARIESWSRFAEKHPDTHLFCARGGMRSAIAQHWISQQSGITFARLEGGYKAFRSYLLENLEPELITSRPVILGGRTGTGKTQVLKGFQNHIDLEDIANHRGSSFGRFTTPQPGQADFENRLAAALIRHRQQGFSHMILEDEGRHVGKRFLPKALWQFFAGGDLIILEASLKQRVENIFEEYVVGGQAEFIHHFGKECGLKRWFDEMNASTDRIGKRLGGERLARVKLLIEAGYDEQSQSGRAESHREWIKLLLQEYYDPMYDYQLEKKMGSLVFRGKADAVREYVESYSAGRI